MSCRLAKLTLATLFLLVIGPEPANADDLPAALSPTASWALAPSDADCTLSRDFGTGANVRTLGFRPSWNGLIGTILLVTSASSDRSLRYDQVKIWVGAMAVPILAPSRSGIADKQRVTEIFIPEPFGPDAKDGDPQFPDPPSAPTMTIQVGRSARVTFALPGAQAGFAALAKCQDAMMDKLGVFPYERRKHARDIAVPNPNVAPPDHGGDWFKDVDYPAAAMKAGQQGDSVIFWTIAEDGSVHDCKTLQSSGFAILDQAACAALIRRGRYVPKIDKQGRPIATHGSRRIAWRLP